jgi:hypothetical protein
MYLAAVSQSIKWLSGLPAAAIGVDKVIASQVVASLDISTEKVPVGVPV